MTCAGAAEPLLAEEEEDALGLGVDEDDPPEEVDEVTTCELDELVVIAVGANAERT